MKAPALQDRILAHLRRASGPASSRDLAARFLRIENADEPACHRLLAPLLAAVPGVIHHPGAGWSLTSRARATTPAAPGTDGPRAAAPATPGGLDDFVALASDGIGPGGSGALRAVSLLPVLGGEPCQEEHFPSGTGGDDGPIIDDPAAPRAPAARPRSAPGGLDDAGLEEIAETIGDLPIVCHRIGRDLEPLRRACGLAGCAPLPQAVSLARLGHLLLGLKANHPLVDLAGALGVTSRGPDDCRGRARLAASCFLELVPLLTGRGLDTWGALAEFEAMPAGPIDLSGRAFTPADLRALPAVPGVYHFLDRRGEVIYIGKAANLRARVATYFVPSARRTAKGQAILDQTDALDVEPTASELEAILLEAALLTEHRPRLNRQFDVHERPAPYGPRLNLVIVLPDPPDAGAPPSCTLHVLRGGRYVQRQRFLGPAGDDSGPGDSIRRAAGACFAGAGAATARIAPGDPGASPAAAGAEVDWRLVASYLRRHRDAVNVLDIDECPSEEAACARLEVLVKAAFSGTPRVLAR